jgi:hypothetical protein
VLRHGWTWLSTEGVNSSRTSADSLARSLCSGRAGVAEPIGAMCALWKSRFTQCGNPRHRTKGVVHERPFFISAYRRIIRRASMCCRQPSLGLTPAEAPPQSGGLVRPDHARPINSPRTRTPEPPDNRRRSSTGRVGNLLKDDRTVTRAREADDSHRGNRQPSLTVAATITTEGCFGSPD